MSRHGVVYQVHGLRRSGRRTVSPSSRGSRFAWWIAVVLSLSPGVVAADVPSVAAPNYDRNGLPVDDAALVSLVVSSQELTARRAALGKAIENGLVVVDGELDSSVERNGAYSSDRDFFYLTGVDLAVGKLLLVVTNGEAAAHLFLPARSPRRELWDGPRPYPSEAVRNASGIDSVHELDAFEAKLAERLGEAPVVYVSGRELPRRRRAAEADRARDLERLAKRYPGAKRFERYTTHIARLRQVKSDFEIAALRRAIAITHAAFDRVARNLRPGLFEFQVEAWIEGEFRFRGSIEPGFPSIVGSGPNNCVLHYHTNRRRMASGELLLMDIGAQGGDYTADISRTMPVDRKFTSRQRKVYDVVLAAQRAAIRAVRPGGSMRDLDRAAREVLTEHGFGRNLPHGVSHHVGLDVHDVSADRALEPGMVITVEPGIYLPKEGFGIRIEDMVLVTADGCEVLSSAIPKSAQAIEAWRGVPTSVR